MRAANQVEPCIPLSIKYLAEAGIATDGLKSQSWDEFEAFEPDVVITVCDSAANEACPVWFGNALKVHWGLEDPSKIDGSNDKIADAFRNTIARIERRVDVLVRAAQRSRRDWREIIIENGASCSKI